MDIFFLDNLRPKPVFFEGASREILKTCAEELSENGFIEEHLPHDLQSFLSQTDGLFCKGYTIYSALGHERDDMEDFPNLVIENEELLDLDWLDQKLIIGTSDDDTLLIWDWSKKSARWCQIDRSFGDEITCHNTLEGLLKDILK